LRGRVLSPKPGGINRKEQDKKENNKNMEDPKRILAPGKVAIFHLRSISVKMGFRFSKGWSLSKKGFAHLAAAYPQKSWLRCHNYPFLE
jgi:hypothetical protein